jgi:hypothetical protein
MASYNKIPVSALARLTGTPDCPIIVDVRIDEDFEDDPTNSRSLSPPVQFCR